MDDNTETNNPPPIPASSDTKNDFSYKEGTILKMRYLWLIIGIVILIPFFYFLCVMIINPKIPIWPNIVAPTCLLFFELIIQYIAMGMKLCIDNINKRIIFKQVGLYSCDCLSEIFLFSEIQRIKYVIEEGRDSEGSYIHLYIDVVRLNGSERRVYAKKDTSSSSNEQNLTVPTKVQEIIDLANQTINDFNNNQIV